MIYKSVLIVLILMTAKDWYLYTSKELNFNILFPDRPQLQSKKINTEIGEIEQSNAYLLNKDSAGIEYQVIVSNYSDSIFENELPDTLHQIIQYTIVKEMQSYLKGQIVYENAAELKGIPCYWYLIRYNDHLALKNCLLWEHNKLFSIMHFSEYENRLSPDSERFFNSFSLLSNK